jgi:hypothetical protein
MNYNKAFEVATKLFEEQLGEGNSPLVYDEQSIDALVQRAKQHIDDFFPSDELKEFVGLTDEGIGMLLFGYYYSKHVEDNNMSYLVPFGPTTTFVSKGDIHHIFYYFSTFKSFVDHCPDVRYYETLFKDTTDGKKKVYQSIEPEYKDSILIYTGMFLTMEDIYNESKTKEYNPESVLTQRISEEIKGIVLEFNPSLISKALKKIDTYVNKKETSKSSTYVGVYDLFTGKLNDVDVSFVRCYCPSTDRMFMLETETGFTKAEDAIASLAKFPSVLKDKINGIRRNGEVFHFEMSQEDIDLVKRGRYPEDKIKELDGFFSGKEYFEMLKFEC